MSRIIEFAQAIDDEFREIQKKLDDKDCEIAALTCQVYEEKEARKEFIQKLKALLSEYE